METKQIKIFYTLGKNPVLSEALAILNCSKEELQTEVAILENELGTRLFHRDDIRWGLNTYGHSFFKSARSILGEMEGIRSTLLEKNKSLPEGPLKISTTQALASLWLPNFVAGFHKRYPKITLEIFSDDRPVDLASGGYDVALRTLMPVSPELVQHYMMTFHVGLYASPKYTNQFGVPTCIDDMDKHAFLAIDYKGNAPYRDADWFLTLGKKSRDLPRVPIFKATSPDAYLKAALDGAGIVSVSEELDYVREGRLVRILAEVKGPEVPIYYICESFLNDSARVVVFKEYLQECVQKQMHFMVS